MAARETPLALHPIDVMQCSAVLLFLLLCGRLAEASQGFTTWLPVKSSQGLTEEELTAHIESAPSLRATTAPPTKADMTRFKKALRRKELHPSPCKCVFMGACSCEAALKFTECISKACASGLCECPKTQYQDSCGDIGNTCAGELAMGCGAAKRATCSMTVNKKPEATYGPCSFPWCKRSDSVQVVIRETSASFPSALTSPSSRASPTSAKEHE